MKNLIFLLSLVIIGCSCNRNTKQPLQLEYLESSWISSDSTCWNIADGFIISDIFDDRRFLVFNYEIVNDTLLLNPVGQGDNKEAAVRFQIVELTSCQLGIRYLGGGSREMHFACNNRYSGDLKPDSTYVFKKYNTFKNDERIKLLKFSTRNGMNCMPSLSLIVNVDSILTFRGEKNVLNEGIGQYKLTKSDFSKIDTMFNRVGLNDFRLYPSCPDANSFTVYIETYSGKTIKCDGILNSNTSDFKRFLVFLAYLETTIPIEKIDKFKDPVTYRKAKQMLDF